MSITITRRQKYVNQGRNVFKSDFRKVKINFDLNTLNLLCSYILSDNKNIRRGALINLRNLFEVIDIESYKNDMEKMKRITFIRKALEGRILKDLRDQTLIIKYVNGGLIDNDSMDLKALTLLSNEELDWINKMVTESLKYSFLYNDIDRLLDVATRFKTSDYQSRGAIVQEIEALVVELQNKFRKVKVESNVESTFTLAPGAFEEVITDIHEQLSNPSRKLYTGMQGFNAILGGYLESGRTYLILGNAGIGKSNTLLNLLFQIKKYNKHYQPKDPSKKPVAVYLTMENSVRETVARLYSLATGREDMTEFNIEEVIHQLKTEGELYLSDESPVNIIIKYMPDKSVDTGYLYTLCEDLEDEGYEVIVLFQDHIKKIRSIYPTTELRLELGEIVNQFKTFAIVKDIPVVTVSHLNRDGARVIDEGKRANKFDLTRQLGRANVGESMLMIDNIDCAYLIGLEFDQLGNKYMAFKLLKSRVKIKYMIEYIAQPFINPGSLRLVEDVGCKVPAFKNTLKPNAADVELYNTGINQKQSYNEIQTIDDAIKNGVMIDDENIFKSASAFSSDSIEDEEESDDNEILVPETIAGIVSTSINSGGKLEKLLMKVEE